MIRRADLTIEALAAMMKNARAYKDGYTASCPAHQPDNNPSLSIDHGDDGRILVSCFAGCEPEAVMAAVGLTMQDLFRDNGNGKAARLAKRQAKSTSIQAKRLARLTTQHSGDVKPAVPPPPDAPGGQGFDTSDAFVKSWGDRAQASYDYHDVDGEHVLTVVRLRDGKSKTFRPCHLDGDRWIPTNIEAGQRPLYHLPDILKAERIYVFEGEKCADLAREWLGVDATTSCGGAKAAKGTDWAPIPAGIEIVIIPDNNKAGQGYAIDVTSMVAPTQPKWVKVVNLPGLADGEDFEQFLGGHDAPTMEELRAELEALVDAAQPVDVVTATVEAVGVEVVATTPQHRVIIRSMATDVDYEEIEWLWPDRIPLGKVSLIAGNAGLGKSLASLDIAANVTTGAAWIDHPGETRTPGDVILLGCEDANGDTVKPRLRAAGAEMSRIFYIPHVELEDEKGNKATEMFSIDRDLHRLEDALDDRPDTRLIIIDPITAFFGRKVKTHVDADVRQVMGPLKEMAEERGIAILGIAHLNKSALQSAVHRVGGSVALVAAARMAWVIESDPEDEEGERRVFARLKGNITKNPGALKFTTEERVIPELRKPQPYIVWKADLFHLDVNELLASKAGRPPESRDRVAEWLSVRLADGAVPTPTIKAEIAAMEFAESTLKRAKKSLDVRSKQYNLNGKLQPCWWLPKDDQPDLAVVP